MDIEVLKQKYQKLWQECAGDEKLFMSLAKVKEKERKLYEKLRSKTKIERSREARALIIFAKLILKTMKKDEVLSFLEAHKDDFLQKERNQLIDYSHYIRNMLK